VRGTVPRISSLDPQYLEVNWNRTAFPATLPFSKKKAVPVKKSSRVVLVNPCWSFERSSYFGCRDPHLPLEFGYARALLEARGHEVLLLDGQAAGCSPAELLAAVGRSGADLVVVTTAPSYLFWRCAPPELRAPLAFARGLRGLGLPLVVVGPHGSSTPGSTLRKFGATLGSWELAVVLGECEEVLAALADRLPGRDLAGACREVPAVCFWDGSGPRVTGGPHASKLEELPALRWTAEEVGRHAHHHHRFEGPYAGPGAEMEVSRGCPYRCSFCAKEHFRNMYRKRPLPVVLEELDRLLAQEVSYVYFIDEIFLPDAPLLAALAQRRRERATPLHFGMQTRIDLWEPAMLERLEAAGCVSIEAGIESISDAGRAALNKRCKLSTEELTARLTLARRYVPFVQANLLDSGADDPVDIERWREELLALGVWANKPVPMLFYPGSPGYAMRWGPPDDQAWERAHAFYLEESREFADFQDQAPLPLPELEAAGLSRDDGH